MNCSNNYAQDFSGIIDTEITTITPRKPSLVGVLLGHTGDTLTEDIRADAEIASFRMQLAEYSMAKIGSLSAMEQQLSRMTPQAAERYQAIVDTVTRQSLKQIERW